jgi:HEXXH motif-containing protein
MSLDLFLAIARGGGGAAAVEVLRSAQDSKTRALLAEIAGRVDGPARPLVRGSYALLAAVDRDDPPAVRRVLRHPVVSAWAVEAARAAPSVGSPGPARMAYVAAAAAIRSGRRHEIALPAPTTPAVPIPTLGHVVLPAAPTGTLLLRTGSGTAQLISGSTVVTIADRAGDPRWQPTARLATEDAGLRIDLLLDRESWLLAPGLAAAGRHALAVARSDPAAWRQHVRDAWQVLVHRHRPVAAEAAATFTMLTPLDDPARGQNSGTYRDAFGCLSMSRPPDPVTGAAAFAHEVQHAKLSALMDLFPLLGDPPPGDEEAAAGYYAPWRLDLRPADGLLHGVYAHLGLASFWAVEAASGEADRRLEAETQFTRWRTGAHEAAHALLAGAPLTPLGRRFVQAALHELHQLRLRAVSATARDRAHRDAEAHRREWTRLNGRVPQPQHCPLPGPG